MGGGGVAAAAAVAERPASAGAPLFTPPPSLSLSLLAGNTLNVLCFS